MQKNKVTKSARIRTPHLDIFFIWLYYTETGLQGLNVFIDTGNGNNRQLIGATGYASGLSIGRCSSLWGLYVFTSCFKEIGKLKPIKVLDKNDHFEIPLSQMVVLSQYLLISKEN